MLSLIALCSSVVVKNNLVGNIPEDVRIVVAKESIRQDCGNLVTRALSIRNEYFDIYFRSHPLDKLMWIHGQAMKRFNVVRDFEGVRNRGYRFDEFYIPFFKEMDNDD